MFLRCHSRQKNGKLHHYWSVVESRRCRGEQSVQRQVFYLGEINDSQEAAWRKTIPVFDEQRQDYRQLALFPAEHPLPAADANALSLKLAEMRLLRPRRFGDCWLGCLLWQELGLDGFWQEKLGGDRGGVPWEKVLQLLAVNRRCDPGSELAVHRSGSSGTGAPWTSCWAAISRWPRRIGCTVAWTASCRTRTNCAASGSSVGRHCFTLRLMYCFTISPAPALKAPVSRFPRQSTVIAAMAGRTAGKWCSPPRAGTTGRWFAVGL